MAALAEKGIRPLMVTGGRGITAELANGLAERGMHNVSVSIDGLEKTHDKIRHRGSFATATRALHLLGDAGLKVSSNINIRNQPSMILPGNRCSPADSAGLGPVWPGAISTRTDETT